MLSKTGTVKNFLESCKLLLVYLQTTKLLLIIKKHIKSFLFSSREIKLFCDCLEDRIYFFPDIHSEGSEGVSRRGWSGSVGPHMGPSVLSVVRAGGSGWGPHLMRSSDDILMGNKGLRYVLDYLVFVANWRFAHNGIDDFLINIDFIDFLIFFVFVIILVLLIPYVR